MLIALASAGMVASIVPLVGPGLSWDKVLHRMLIPMGRMLVFLAVGLLAGQIIESLGWTTRIARVVRPVTRWAHLKDESGAAFIASFVSGLLANTMLVTYHREGKLSDKEMFVTYLLGKGLPVFLLHLPTVFFITISLAGKAGIIYLAIAFSAALIRSIGVLLYARLTLPPAHWGWSPLVPDAETRRVSFLRDLRVKFLDRFTRLLLYSLPIYIIVFTLNHWGIFHGLETGGAGWVSEKVFPLKTAGAVAFTFAAEFSAGMAAAGSMTASGVLTVKQAALALVAGTVVSTPLRTIRYQLPTHVGLFSLSTGSRLLAGSQALRIASFFAISIPYAVWG